MKPVGLAPRSGLTLPSSVIVTSRQTPTRRCASLAGAACWLQAGRLAANTIPIPRAHAHAVLTSRIRRLPSMMIRGRAPFASSLPCAAGFAVRPSGAWLRQDAPHDPTLSWRPPAVGCARGRCQDELPAHRHVLRLEELHQTLVCALAAEARLLHAAERCRRIGDEAAVEADHAELELLRHAHAAAQVLGVEVGDEPVLGVVGALDRLLIGLEGLDRRDGPEDL